VPKTSSSDVTDVAPSGLGCAAWRLGVCCQVIKENQRSLERMAPSRKWDPAKRKRFGRGSRKRMAPSGVRCLPGGVCSIGIFLRRFAPGGTRILPSGLLTRRQAIFAVTDFGCAYVDVRSLQCF